MDGFAFGAANPFREFNGVGCGCREKDEVDVVGKHDDDFFPGEIGY